MVSQKLYFALLVSLVVMCLVGCSSEKADDDFDLSGFNVEEYRIETDYIRPLFSDEIAELESAEECALVEFTVRDGSFEISAQESLVSSIYFAKGDALNHIDELEAALKPVYEKWGGQPDGKQIRVNFEDAPWADNPVDFVKVAKTYRPLIACIKNVGFDEVIVNWKDVFNVFENKEVRDEESNLKIEEFFYLTYRALGLHWNTPRERAAKYHNRPRCKPVNRSLLDSLKRASQIQRNLEYARDPLDEYIQDRLRQLL